MCGFTVTYSSKIMKTANANAFRSSYFPDTSTSYSINSIGVLLPSGYLYFINYSSVTKMFYISTDDLLDAGTYTIYVTATAYDLQNVAQITNSVLTF